MEAEDVVTSICDANPKRSQNWDLSGLTDFLADFSVNAAVIEYEEDETWEAWSRPLTSSDCSPGLFGKGGVVHRMATVARMMPQLLAPHDVPILTPHQVCQPIGFEQVLSFAHHTLLTISN